MKNLTIKIKSILLIICGSILLYSISMAAPEPLWNTKVPEILHGTWILESKSFDQGKTQTKERKPFGVMTSNSLKRPLGAPAWKIDKTLTVEDIIGGKTDIILYFESGEVWAVLVFPDFYPRIAVLYFPDKEDFLKQKKEKIRYTFTIKK